jgi:hypothetical protein
MMEGKGKQTALKAGGKAQGNMCVTRQPSPESTPATLNTIQVTRLRMAEPNPVTPCTVQGRVHEETTTHTYIYTR